MLDNMLRVLFWEMFVIDVVCIHSLEFNSLAKININWSIETCSGVSKQINEKLIKGNCYSIYFVICLANRFHRKEKFILERQITGELEYVIYF